MVEPNDYEKDTRAMVAELRQMINDDFKFLNQAIESLRTLVTNHLMHSFSPTATVIISLLTGLLGVAIGALSKVVIK